MSRSRVLALTLALTMTPTLTLTPTPTPTLTPTLTLVLALLPTLTLTVLPHLLHSPEHLFPLNTTFEAFGVGIYTYMKVVRRAADFFAVLFLMSMSNMVSNFYGGALDREAPHRIDELRTAVTRMCMWSYAHPRPNPGPNPHPHQALSHMSYRMWFFTVTSIGNSGALTPSYGVMEFLLSSVMVVGLYRIRSELQACTAEALAPTPTPTPTLRPNPVPQPCAPTLCPNLDPSPSPSPSLNPTAGHHC